MGTSKPKTNGYSEKVSRDFEDKMSFLRRDDNLPRTLYRNLATANPENPGWQEVSIAGNFLYLYRVGNPLDVVEVRFDKISNPTIYFSWGSRIYTPYNKLYLRWGAQAGGEATFIFGANAAIGKQMLDLEDDGRLAVIADGARFTSPITGTQILINGTANNANPVVYTVPAGHTLYITSMQYSSRTNAVAEGNIEIWDTVPALADTIVTLYNSTGAGLLHANGSRHCSPPIIVPAGYQVRLNSNNAGHIFAGSIVGILI